MTMYLKMFKKQLDSYFCVLSTNLLVQNADF